ncbi:hypothetical protein [Dermatobacter hominis]|uniref:hypothetical protein n=1 Tax=Dermatobacter hominis TaxID=2884263 RepID=UPI001D11173A|nr:hypothetical protein [Dermatobacter hominis]UDY35886.1 hypothetical protein LH044_21530 [Dermatobacter hominis]
MMTDSERRAREVLAAATDDVTTSPDLDARVHGLTSSPRRPHRLLAVGAVATAAVLAAVVAWVVIDDDASQLLTPAEHPTTTEIGPSLPTDRWTDLPPPPAPVAARASVGVPGGAVFWEARTTPDATEDLWLRLWHLDLSSGRWTSAQPEGASGGEPTGWWWPGDAVWTGDELIGVLVDTTPNHHRTTPFDTVRWRPGDASITRGTSIPRPTDVEGRVYKVELTPTGDGVAALASYQEPTGATRTLVWSYDAGADEWTRLPDPPTTSDRVFSIDWTGKEIVVLAGRPTPLATYYDGLQLLRFRPGDDSWREASRPPDAFELSGQAADASWAGDRLVVVTYAPSAGTWDPATDTWTALPVPPFEGAEDYPRVLATDDGTIVAGLGNADATLPAGGSSWTALPSDGVRPAVDSGAVLIGQRWEQQADGVQGPSVATRGWTSIGLP